MLLYISGATILLSVLLALHNWRINRNSIYLSLCFIVISIYTIAHHFTVIGKDPFWLAIFYNHFAPLSFLAGPFIFFYVRGTLKDSYLLSKTDMVHFIPFVLHFIGIIPYIMMPFDDKLVIARSIIADLDTLKSIDTNFLIKVSTALVFRPFLLAAYVVYCSFLLFGFSPYKSNNINIPKNQFLITYRWLIILLTTLFLLSVSFLIVSLQFITIDSAATLEQSGRLYYMTGGILGFMALMLLFFPQVLYGLPSYVEKVKESDAILGLNNTTKESASVFGMLKKKGQNDDPFVELAERIQKLVVEEKPFLDPGFTIENLAASLDVPLNHVTYCLNNVLDIKFTVLRMKLRVDHAIHLLKEGKTNDLTIEAIAQQAGFSTRSSFYNPFKAETGITPKEFLKK